MTLRLFPAAHRDGQQAQVVGRSAITGGGWANHQGIAVMRQEALIEHCSTASITHKGAHLREVHETGNPPSIAGNVSEVLSGQAFKLSPCFLLQAKFTIDQRQAWPPGGGF